MIDADVKQMASEGLKKTYFEITRLKEIILENNNIDILLFLAKYNPNVPRKDILTNFGKESLSGLEDLKGAKLVVEVDSGLSLTDEGIFQVDGLLSISV